MNKRSWQKLVAVLAISFVSTSNQTEACAHARTGPGAKTPPAADPAPTIAKVDRPTEQVWSGQNSWTAEREAQYSAFISALGTNIAQNRCRTLAACLNDPAVNPLPESFGRPLHFRADCADVPYILRAYFSYVHDLPFRFTKEMVGTGRDARYYRNAQPKGVRTFRDFETPRKLFEHLSSAVHSGFFRSTHTVEESDFYQTQISRLAIRPGTMFYDPNGHVLVVYGLRPDGSVMTFDGHPDGFLTHGVLSERNQRGGESQGGGFKNFRPLRWDKELLAQKRNQELADFGGGMQFDRTRYVVDGLPVSYHDWVRAQLQDRTAQAAAM
ncbi:MAG TPA: hypothetical protein PKL17_10420 [Pseudomonadota bacterium]|nr:hypothetical protein [Pseudomonadota bacterium]